MERAVRIFLRHLDGKYAICGAVVFGSRARGTHRADSDADVAVILSGPKGDRYKVAGAMARIAFDVMLETGVLVGPLPLWEIELERPESFGQSRSDRAHQTRGFAAVTEPVAADGYMEKAERALETAAQEAVALAQNFVATMLTILTTFP